jgi:ubiquinone/menaquinone biosynthesis C-methylase UbiE
MATTELDQIKQHARAAWAAGDFPAVAERQLWPIGARVVDRIGVRPGEHVLDVACGTGNAGIRAAQAGGRVVGVDLTPELFEAGRRMAAAAGVELEWVEGDAEALPVADASVDVVVSVFGCMFAPRHRVTASELARVLRPGGRLCLTAWTPDGAVGAMFRTLGGYMPPPPEWVEPPLAWGTEEHVRELFAGTGVEVEFAREVAEFAEFETVEEELAWTTSKFGPLVMARQALEAQGRWEELLDDLRRLLADKSTPAEYLVTVGRRYG